MDQPYSLTEDEEDDDSDEGINPIYGVLALIYFAVVAFCAICMMMAEALNRWGGSIVRFKPKPAAKRAKRARAVRILDID